jgi:Tfp pilus assembly protein PilF
MIKSPVFGIILAAGIIAGFDADFGSAAQIAEQLPASDSIQVQSQVRLPSPLQEPQSFPAPQQSQAAVGNDAKAPTPPPSPEDLGDSLTLHQRYQAAITAYQGARRTAAIWNKMGIAYQMMLNVHEATHCYKESLKLDPHNAMVVNNLATVYDSQKDYTAAERLYRKAIKMDPNSAMVYKNLGTNLLSQHKYERGWAAYQQALQLDPQIFADRGTPQVQNPATIAERGAMNYYMAVGCVRMGQTACALEYLRKALDEGFTNPKKVAADMAFASLRENPDFKQLLASQQNAKPEQAR